MCLKLYFAGLRSRVIFTAPAPVFSQEAPAPGIFFQAAPAPGGLKHAAPAVALDYWL